MTKTTALVLDKTDYTRDGNLKSEVFEAIIAADVVVHNDRVVKNNLRSVEPSSQEFLALDKRAEPRPEPAAPSAPEASSEDTANQQG